LKSRGTGSNLALNNFMTAFGLSKVPNVLRGPLLSRILRWSFAGSARAMLRTPWPPTFGRGGPAMLVIANEQDAILPPSELWAFARLHPKCEYWLAPQAPHLRAFRLHPGAYRNVVLDFLAYAFRRGVGAR
jgi:hypothetical protein